MQDFRSMMSGGGGGGGGRIFGGERRLRPFPNQALKCPRCDSLNTKFCYYNNYNLSQPRHFCKSCRRYWTKGGVLRNVPVGGGCRKTKRSKPPKTSSNGEIEKEKKSSTASHSSSDSSSLTATTTTEAASSNPSAAAASASTLLNFPDSTTTTTTTTLLSHQNPNSNVMFEQSMIHVNGNTTTSRTSLDQLTEKNEMFPDTGGGGFTSLMNGSNPSPSFLGFNFSPFRLNHHENQEQEQHILHQQQQQQQKMMVEDQLKFHELTKGLYGETTVVPVVDMHGLPNRTTTTTTMISNGGLTGLDWQQQSSSNGIGGILHDHDHHHQGLFDLPNSTSTVVVDHQSYWSHHTSQWTENDHSLYLP